MKTNTISIIVIMYNVEKHLFQCLESIVNQTNDNFIVLLINDGSTDNSENIAKEFVSTHPKEFKLFNKEMVIYQMLVIFAKIRLEISMNFFKQNSFSFQPKYKRVTRSSRISIYVLICGLFVSLACLANNPTINAFDINKQAGTFIEYGDRTSKSNLTFYQDKLYFTTNDKGLGEELWVYVPSTGEEKLLLDINIGTKGSSPRDLVVYHNKLYFSAYTEEYDRELWVYDGGTAQAQRISNLTDYEHANYSLLEGPRRLTLYNDKLYFWRTTPDVYIRELWSYNEENGSFSHIKGIKVNAHSMFGAVELWPLVVYQESLYFFDDENYQNTGEISSAFAYNEQNDSYQAVEKTTEIKLLASSHLQIGHLLYGSLRVETGRFELVRLNTKTQEITALISNNDEYNISQVHNLIHHNNNLYFTAWTSSSTLRYFKYDIGTSTLSKLNVLNSYPILNSANYQDKLYFSAKIASGESLLWRYDVTLDTISQASLSRIQSHASSSPTDKVIYQDKLYFSADDGIHGRELFVYNPDTDTSELVADVLAGSAGANIRELTVLGEHLYFIASLDETNSSLWQFDGKTQEYTQKLQLANDDNGNGISGLTVLNDKLAFNSYYAATDDEDWRNIGHEIWLFDSLDGSSTHVTDIPLTNSADKSSPYSSLTPYNGKLYFTVNKIDGKSQLWVYDPLSSVYSELTKPLLLSSSSSIYTGIDDVITFNNKLYFTYDNDNYLTCYNATINALCESIIDLPDGWDIYNDTYNVVSEFSVFQGRLYFQARWTYAVGYELFRFNEGDTEAELVIDLSPGICCWDDQSWEGKPFSSYPKELFSYNNELFFNASSQLYKLTTESIQPQVFSSASDYDKLTAPTDIISFKGAIFASAKVIKGGVYYGIELVKIDFNVSPTLVVTTKMNTYNNSLTELDASLSTDDDGDELIFTWQQLSGTSVELMNANANKMSFIAPDFKDNEVLTFQLSVSDSENTVEKTVSVTVLQANRTPEVTIKTEKIDLAEGAQVILSALATDADNDQLSYLWQQLSGTSVELMNANANKMSFIAPGFKDNEVLTFQLSVSDSENTVEKTVSVTVLQANRTPKVTIKTEEIDLAEGAQVTLSALATDADNDELSYLWQQVSGPAIHFDNVNAVQVSFTLPQVNNNALIEIKVTVTDGALDAAATTQLTITDVPKVNAEVPKKSGGTMLWLLMLMVITSGKRMHKNKQ